MAHFPICWRLVSLGCLYLGRKPRRGEWGQIWMMGNGDCSKKKKIKQAEDEVPSLAFSQPLIFYVSIVVHCLCGWLYFPNTCSSRSGLWFFPYSWVCLSDALLKHNAVWFLRLSLSWDTYPGTWPLYMRKVRLSVLWLLYPPGPANSHAFFNITSPGKPDQIFQVWVPSSPLGTSSHTSSGLYPTVCNCLLPWLDWEQTESWSCLLIISPAASTAPCTGWALNKHLLR